jgi:hypothetical protein
MPKKEVLPGSIRSYNLIFRGRLKVSLEAARKLVGPDCAYHLYSVVDLKTNRKNRGDRSG